MSDPQNNDINAATTTQPRRRRMWPILLAVGLLAMGAFAIPRAMALMGHGWGHHRGGHGEMTTEGLTEHMTMFTDHVLTELDATDEQRAEVQVLIDGLAPEIVALHDEAAELKQALRDALSADELDVDEIERLRSQSVDLFDRGSSLALENFVELHGILTVEQREQIREFAERHHRGGHGEPCAGEEIE